MFSILVSSMSTAQLHQLRDRSMVTYQMHRATGRRVIDFARIDSKFPIDRGDIVLGRQDALNGCMSLSIRRADELSPMASAASEEYRHRIRPMITTRFGLPCERAQFWRSAEFS